jgi:hypothetical protein
MRANYGFIQPLAFKAGVTIMAMTAVTIASGGDRGQTAPNSRKTVQAIRIELAPKRDTYSVGEDPALTLRLIDPQGHPVQAPKDFTITVAATVKGANPITRSVRIAKGQTTQEFALKIGSSNVTGAVQIRATHPELVEGGAVLYVAPKKRSGRTRPYDSFDASVGVLAPPWTRAVDDGVISLFDVVPARFQPGEGKCMPSMFVAPGSAKADGQDSAEVTIVEEVTMNTAFFLTTTVGTLDPNPIVIKAGQTLGKARISSEIAKEAVISCAKVVPPFATSGVEPVHIAFKQPVNLYELKVAPPKIYWVDKTEIIVTLLRAPKVSVKTDDPVSISLHRDSGNGEIQPETIEIKAGEFEGRSTFLPYKKGLVRISAVIPNFVSDSVDFEVTALPYLMFMLPSFGGICGGLVASTRRPAGKPGGRRASSPPTNKRLERTLVSVMIGLLTGTLLHWAFVFNLVPALPRAVVMNQFSWFVLPAIGGWLGTKVFDVVLKVVGIGTFSPVR